MTGPQHLLDAIEDAEEEHHRALIGFRLMLLGLVAFTAILVGAAVISITCPGVGIAGIVALGCVGEFAAGCGSSFYVFEELPSKRRELRRAQRDLRDHTTRTYGTGL